MIGVPDDTKSPSSPSKLQNLPAWQQTIVVFLVFAVLCVLLGLIAEGAVRIRHYLKHGDMWGVEKTFTMDAETGLRVLLPSIDRGGIRTNSLGFRGPELAAPKPEGTIRLAFLGGSTTYGAEASSNEATWPDRVTEGLKKRWPDVRFDYVNAGTPGYTVRTSLINFKARVTQLEPDVIVIYHAVNDLAANSFQLAAGQGLVEKTTEENLSWLSRYSLLWYLVEKNLFVKLQQGRAQAMERKLDVDSGLLAAPFEQDMTELVRAAGESAAYVVLPTFSHHLRAGQSAEQQAVAAVTNLYYMPYMSVPGFIEGFAAYNKAIRRVAAELGVHLIDGEDEIPGDSEHFVDSVHFTDAGNELMAARIINAMLSAPAFEQLVESKKNKR